MSRTIVRNLAGSSNSKICSAQEAIATIKDNQSIGCIGVIGWITPDLLLKTLGEKFEKTAEPCNLTFYFPCGTGDAMEIRGMDHVAREGLMKRIVSGSYINPTHPRTGQRPELMRLIRENKIEAYSWPIGATMHWLREVARRSPGYLTRIGLGTYIDPHCGGGKFTARCEQNLVEKILFRGQDYLFYPTWNLDVAFIRATSSDEHGNLSFEHEPIVSSSLALAMAAKACGGTVIAQVQRLVPLRSRSPQSVRVPGVLVDKVVVSADQMMVTNTQFDERYLDAPLCLKKDLAKLPLTPHKVIARLVGREVKPAELSVFGFGASSDAPSVMVEDGILTDENVDQYNFTTEHGSFGGVVMSDWQFSANLNPLAMVDGVSQFDLIDGGLCRFAALAFAQFDRQGRVNVSRFGNANPGAGGFIDIAHAAKRLVFAGTMTTGGSNVTCSNGGLDIIHEGKVKKLVNCVDHITYDVCQGIRERGQKALVVTERAIFQVEPNGLALVEVAPGIDVQDDVLAQMEFLPIRIANPLPTIDSSYFESLPLRPENSA